MGSGGNDEKVVEGGHCWRDRSGGMIGDDVTLLRAVGLLVGVRGVDWGYSLVVWCRHQLHDHMP